jgi:predicted ATP-binding protein involved in virulence
MLPIALKSFHIKNYRGIKNTKVDNIPPDTQWIFLTGENGFGKTSVLQGLAKGLYYHDNPSKHHFDCHLHKNHNLSIKDFQKSINSKEDEENIKGIISNPDFKHYTVIGYGSTRLRVSAGTVLEVLRSYNSIESLFSNEVLLVNIEENFKDWKTNYKEGYEQLENIFKTLIPKLGKIEVEVEEKTKRNKVKYYELDSDLDGNLLEESVELNDLAAGYKNIFGMVGDMINRLTDEYVPDDLSSIEGIVIIDEIDLHLHPKYQKLFVQKLTELFPKIQFIVSTHSPIPLLGAPPNSVIINVSRTREEGIKAELLDIDFSVLTPNAILSSPIFGFQDLIPDSKPDDKMIRTEDTFQEVEFNDQLKKNINEFLTEDKQKELLDLLKIKAL